MLAQPNRGKLPRARKRFGQHFLHDPLVIDRILRSIDPRPNDHLVEIGPGSGILTLPLLQSSVILDAIELDRDLAIPLRTLCRDHPHFNLHMGDALRFDYVALAQNGQLRLVGNLPYNISTPLLFRLLRVSGHIRDMHFMLQKEVVDRLTAQPGTRNYGRLTVTVAARAEATALFDVGPEAFKPPPRVWSSVVRIVPRPAPFSIPSFEAFDRTVTAAFSQRRKTLANSLRGLITVEQIRIADIDPGQRAERLTPADFARLAAQLPDAPQP